LNDGLTVSERAKKQAWARFIQHVYETDPLECPYYCGSEMRIIAVILNKDEISKIIKHLAKNKNKAPPEIVAIPGY